MNRAVIGSVFESVLQEGLNNLCEQGLCPADVSICLSESLPLRQRFGEPPGAWIVRQIVLNGKSGLHTLSRNQSAVFKGLLQRRFIVKSPRMLPGSNLLLGYEPPATFGRFVRMDLQSRSDVRDRAGSPAQQIENIVTPRTGATHIGGVRTRDNALGPRIQPSGTFLEL